jgi:hypothetical protein
MRAASLLRLPAGAEVWSGREKAVDEQLSTIVANTAFDRVWRNMLTASIAIQDTLEGGMLVIDTATDTVLRPGVTYR